MIRVAAFLVSAVAATLLVLAHHSDPAAAQSPATGVITGSVVYKGTPPARAWLKRDTDPYCAKSKMRSEKVVVTGGKLRDVHVRIKSGTAGKHKAPARPAKIVQTKCMYRPRVVGVMEGQKLAIYNGDPTYHNVHGRKGGKYWFNLSQPAKAPAIVRKDLGKAGTAASLKCDVHPWMRAHLPITDHPFFDVTESNGAFMIKNVPVGTYTLEAWHPELGLKKTRVRVRKGKITQAKFVFGR
jgi:hypothetical protein